MNVWLSRYKQLTNSSQRITIYSIEVFLIKHVGIVQNVILDKYKPYMQCCEALFNEWSVYSDIHAELILHLKSELSC